MITKNKHGFDVTGYGDECGELLNLTSSELHELAIEIMGFEINEATEKRRRAAECVK